jgi:hypothetical protein
VVVGFELPGKLGAIRERKRNAPKFVNLPGNGRDANSRPLDPPKHINLKCKGAAGTPLISAVVIIPKCRSTIYRKTWAG